MKYTKEQMINYLIDCIGYGEEDFEGMHKSEIWDMIEDKNEFEAFTN